MGTHPIFESDFDCLTEIETENIEMARRTNSSIKDDVQNDRPQKMSTQSVPFEPERTEFEKSTSRVQKIPPSKIPESSKSPFPAKIPKRKRKIGLKSKIVCVEEKDSFEPLPEMPRSAKRRKSFKDNLIVYDSMSDKPGPSCSHGQQEPLRLTSPDCLDQEDFNANTTHFDCLGGTSKNSSQKDDFSKGHDCDSLLALPKGDFDTHENQMVNRLLETHENNLKAKEREISTLKSQLKEKDEEARDFTKEREGWHQKELKLVKENSRMQVELGVLKNENNTLKKSKNEAESAHYDEKNRLENELRSVKSQLERRTKDAHEFHGKKEMYKKEMIRNAEL